MSEPPVAMIHDERGYVALSEHATGTSRRPRYAGELEMINGIRVIIDPTVPEDQLHFRHPDGRVDVVLIR